MDIVFDIEGNGLYQDINRVWCITTKNIASDAIDSSVLSFSDETTKGVHGTIQDGLDMLYEADRLIGHNIINFDLPALKKLFNWEPKKSTVIEDTLVMSRLFFPDRAKPKNYTGKGGPHSLGSWGYRVGRGKPEHEDWSKFSQEMLHRNKEDVEINALTYFALYAEAGEWDWKPSLKLEQDIARIITQQEINGVLFDKKRAEECVRYLDSVITKIDNEVVPQLPKRIKQRGSPVLEPFTSTGAHTKKYREDISYCSGPFTRIEFIPFDLGSTQQIKEYLLAHGWKPESWNFSKTTGERTSPKLEGEFEGVEGDLPVQVKNRITNRHRKSQIEGWIDRVRKDGRLTAGANPNGTNTGRMKHNTVVNVPKANADKQGNLIWELDKQKFFFGTQMRSLFISRPYYNLVGYDAKGLELRMLAHYMNDPEYTEVLLNDDIHTYNQLKAGLGTRDEAKTFIYAFIYGAGDTKLGSIIGGGQREGAEIRKAFLKSLPALDRLIKQTKKEADKGFLKGLDNRKIWMRRDSDDRVMSHKALNTKLQCGGSLVMKKSTCILWDELLPKTNIKAYKVIDMHDESQSEVSFRGCEEYSNLCKSAMVMSGEFFNLNVPMEADVKIGKNWAETH